MRSLLLLLAVFNRNISCLKYCSHGDMDTIRAPYVEECSTKKLHLTDVVSLNRNERSSEQLMTQMLNPTDDQALSNEKTSKQYCLTFTYFPNQNLSSDDHRLLISTRINANFSCDHSSICKNDSVISNFNYNGKNGTLYCCSNSDECNSPSKSKSVLHLPPNQLMCYNGINKNSKVIPCNDPRDFCAVSTYRSNGNTTYVHYCDRQKCKQNEITNFVASYKKCKNITKDGVTEELCCCVHSKCNNPHVMSVSDNINSPDYTDVKILVLCIVIGVVVALVFIFVVYSLVKRHFKKLKSIRDNARAVRMSYKEINADEVSNSETAHILYL